MNDTLGVYSVEGKMASDRLATALIQQMPPQIIIVGADSIFLLWFYPHDSGLGQDVLAYGAVICRWCCYLHMVLLFADGWWFGSPQEDGC